MCFQLKIQILTVAVLLNSSISLAENCWKEAGDRYGIDPWLLYAIAEQESNFDPNAINDSNKNLTRDVGLMQINSFWLPKLKEYGISESDLFDPCINIHVGAWVLAQSIKVFGYNWEAIGAYNAGTKRTAARSRLRERYAVSVYRRYAKYRRLYD